MAAPPSAYVVQQAQPSVVFGATSSQANVQVQQKRERKYLMAFKVTGWLQVSLGIVTVIFGIAAIIIRAWYSFYVTPIWMGILFFTLTGTLGVIASKKRKKGVMVAFMTMSIITTLAAFSLCIMYCILATFEDEHFYRYRGGPWSSTVYVNVCFPGDRRNIIYNCHHKIAGRQVVDALIALAAFTEGITAIVSACYCCYAVCRGCCTQTPTTTAYYTSVGMQSYPGQPPAPGHVYVQVPQTTYVMPQGPGMVVQGPGMMAQGPGMVAPMQGAPVYYAQPAPMGAPPPAQQFNTSTQQQAPTQLQSSYLPPPSYQPQPQPSAPEPN